MPASDDISRSRGFDRDASEQRFRAVAKHTADWEKRFGPDVPLLWINPAVASGERIAGFSVDQCLATHCLTGG
jgi:hypothetical protein